MLRSVYKRCSFLGVLALLFSMSCACGQDGSFNLQRNIVYGKGGGVPLYLDLATPAVGKGPFPLVVCIHGGAWRMGNKNAYLGWVKDLAKHGYVAATVAYRFCPKHPFPAQVEDVKCAVRFLRANARRFKIDPTRVAAMGSSAGGHLSLMLGLMDPKDGLEGQGGSPGISSKVQAVVNYYGPADFTKVDMWSPIQVKLVSDFLATQNANAPIVAQASPITYVNKGDPPVLTLQGTKDPLVPLPGAQRLHAALKAAGVPEHLEIIQGAGHGFRGEAKKRTTALTMAFLEKELKGKR